MASRLSSFAPLCVVETPHYRSRASQCMTAQEQADALLMIARDPECGQLIKGGGGIRKVRFATGGGGKRGGVRIIYHFYDMEHPAFLLTVYAKNEMGDLSDAQRQALAKAVKMLIESC